MSDPITQSYLVSDAIGKAIFIGLFLLSVMSWTIIIYRSLQLWRAQASDERFNRYFESNRHRVLNLSNPQESNFEGPMATVYRNLSRYTLDLLAKNRQFGAVEQKTGSAYLSMDDVQVISDRAQSEVLSQLHQLESQLHHLSTIVTLSPFLGLLGTVWGILTSFSTMQSASTSNDAILTGLSMALATTVVGLIVAIPALLGYNILRQWIKKFDSVLSGFCAHAINVIELQYRNVDKPD